MSSDSSSLPVLAPKDQRELLQLGVESFPVLIQRAGKQGWRAFLNFFGAEIENDNTRAADLKAVCEFLEQCDQSGITELKQIEPFMVGAYLKHLRTKGGRNGTGLGKPSVKLKLAGLRKFFDHFVVNQVIPSSPALSVRGPKLKIEKGKTPVLSLEDFQNLVGSIDRSTLVGKRDYAWLVLAFTSWCSVSALEGLAVRDYEHSGKRSFIRVEEKGSKSDRKPVHHKAQEAVDELLVAAAIGDDKKSPIFQSVNRDGTYSGRPFRRNKVWEMVRRRAKQAEVSENICCHTFRGTGITEFRRAGGDIKVAQKRANHADPRTTAVYDRSEDDETLEDVELVQF